MKLLNLILQKLSCSFLISLLLVGFAASSTSVSAANWNAGRIIDDSKFTNKSSMSASQIQSFLNSKSVCLKNYQTAEPLGNNQYGSKKSAAHAIWKSAQLFDINPQVLIVTLQKEQGLVARNDCPSWRYKTAMGFGCPDGAPCDSQWFGLSRQLYQAARHLRGFYDQQPGWFIPFKPGNRFIQWSPNGACGGKNVNIQNRATASLYSYTPYQPNSAAINAGYGEGNDCSSYGNRNFWLYYNAWFGSSIGNGSPLLFKIGNSETFYFEWEDRYYPIPSMDVLRAYGLGSETPRILSEFPSGKTQGNALSRIAKFGSNNPSHQDYTPTVTLVDEGKMHNAPNWAALNAHGYDSFTSYDADIKTMLEAGNSLTNLVREPDGSISLMEEGNRRIFPDYESFSTLRGTDHTSTVSAYSSKSVTNMSRYYASSKNFGAPMLLSGKFIKGDDGQAIYLYEDNEVLTLTPDTFASWGKKIDYTLPQDAVDELVNNNSQAPYLIKSESDIKYIVDDGRKLKLGSAEQTAWSIDSDEFIEVSDRTLERLKELNASRLIKTPGSVAVYEIIDGRSRVFADANAFSKLGNSTNNVQKISKFTKLLVSDGSALFAPGTLIRQPDGTVFVINNKSEALRVPSMEYFSKFGFSWSKVRNINSNTYLSDYSKTQLQILQKNGSSYYVIDSGKKHTISNGLMSPDYFDYNSASYNNAHSKFLEVMPSGKPLTKYLQGSGQTVYLIEDGEKRPFNSQSSFFNNGGSWDKVVRMSDQFLLQIQTGSSL